MMGHDLIPTRVTRGCPKPHLLLTAASQCQVATRRENLANNMPFAHGGLPLNTRLNIGHFSPAWTESPHPKRTVQQLLQQRVDNRVESHCTHVFKSGAPVAVCAVMRRDVFYNQNQCCHRISPCLPRLPPPPTRVAFTAGMAYPHPPPRETDM